MDKYQETDEIDELLLEYFKYKKDIESIVVPQSTQKMAQRVIKRLKFQNNLKKLSRVAVIFITVGILTTGVVFAKDIVNFVTSLFTNSTPAIDTAVENGYVQNIDMDYVYSNDIGVKVEQIVFDNFSLDISFAYKSSEKNINTIEIEDYTILTENEDVIYNNNNNITDKIPLAHYIVRNSSTEKVSSEKYIESVLFNFDDEIQNFDYLHFTLSGLKIIENDNTIKRINGNWNFQVELDSNMKKNTNILYDIDNKDYIENSSVKMTETGLIIEIKLNFPVNLEQFKNINSCILENETLETFEPYLIECSENEKIKIYYNNISKYSDNINSLTLNLKYNEKDMLNLKLKKVTN